MTRDLDALEAIPTLSLEDFLRPSFAAAGSSSLSLCDSESASVSASASVAAAPYDQDTDLDAPEEVDPRVAGALDELNSAMSENNELEVELAGARRRRKHARSASTREVEATRKKLRCVLYESFSPIARFQQLIAFPFN
jgi:hypothetical protein